MKKHVRIPLRRKILFSVMLGLTVTVGLITFTMARFFHEDKQAYINDWITTATSSFTVPPLLSRSVISGKPLPSGYPASAISFFAFSRSNL